jgi:hypothetical protein
METPKKKRNPFVRKRPLIHFSIDAELKATLQEIADAAGVKVNKVIEIACAHYLKNNGGMTPSRVAEDAQVYKSQISTSD